MKLTVYTKSDTPPDIEGTQIFHSVGFFHLIEKTSGIEPVMVMAYNSEEEPVGRMVGVIKRDFRWLPPMWFRWCTVYGAGEFFNGDIPDEEIFSLMLKKLTDTVSSRCWIMDFRNLEHSLFGYRHFRKNGFIPLNYIRVYNSLHSMAPEERLTRRCRYNIRKAQLSGAFARIAETEEEILQTVTLIKNNYVSKISKFFPKLNFFTELLKINTPHESNKIFCVKYQGKIIGGSVCVFSRNRAYLLYSAGLKKSYSAQHPGVLAVWEAISYSYREGYEHFEFFDAALPLGRKIGYLNFILNFGGKQTSTRRWLRVSWRWLNKILERIYV